MVKGNVPEGEVRARLEEYGVNILGASRWMAAVISTEMPEKEEQDSLPLKRELIPISVKQFMEDSLKPYFRFAIFNSTSNIIIIVAIDEFNTQTGFIDALEDTCKEAGKILGVTITVGVGRRKREA